MKRTRLQWLGHLARMSDDRLPKSALFSCLPQPSPRCEPRKRWRDIAHKDLRDIEVDESVWYGEARRSRAGWGAMYCTGLEDCRDIQRAQASEVVREVVCEMCFRSFRRESDKKP